MRLGDEQEEQPERHATHAVPAGEEHRQDSDGEGAHVAEGEVVPDGREEQHHPRHQPADVAAPPPGEPAATARITTTLMANHAQIAAVSESEASGENSTAAHGE